MIVFTCLFMAKYEVCRYHVKGPTSMLVFSARQFAAIQKHQTRRKYFTVRFVSYFRAGELEPLTFCMIRHSFTDCAIETLQIYAKLLLFGCDTGHSNEVECVADTE